MTDSMLYIIIAATFVPLAVLLIALMRGKGSPLATFGFWLVPPLIIGLSTRGSEAIVYIVIYFGASALWAGILQRLHART